MFKSIALIPARSGSKRIKDKNIKLLKGHPLIAYTIRSALDSKVFDQVVCVTDSKKYKKIAEKYGAYVPFLRPKKISSEKSPDIEWVNWIMKKISKESYYHIFSILRPTNPLRDENVIKKAFKKFISIKCHSLRAVSPCKQHPYKMWKIKGKYILPVFDKKNKIPFHSRQYADLPRVFEQNASLEFAWTRILKKKNSSISGTKIVPFFSRNFEGFDINRPEDFKFLKFLIETKMVKLKKI